MATVITGTGEVLTEYDPSVLDYYRSEGFAVSEDAVAAPSFPMVFNGESYSQPDQPVEVEQLPEGESADPSGPVQAEGGEPLPESPDADAQDSDSADETPAESRSARKR